MIKSKIIKFINCSMDTTNDADVLRENLLNITVVADKSWDNVAKIMRRIDNKCSGRGF
jgi:hypothetical protein